MAKKYKYQLYYDGGYITESDFDFDSEEEAIEEVQQEIRNRIHEWKVDNAWHDDDSIDDFDYEIEEMEEL